MGQLRKAGRQRSATDRRLRRDLRILAHFMAVYCRYKHPDRTKKAPVLKHHDVAAIAGRTMELCAECTRLLTHAFVKRSTCPLDPKPACKHCPQHCYHPTYRAQIREVMRYSGRRLVLSGRLDYLIHLLF